MSSLAFSLDRWVVCVRVFRFPSVESSCQMSPTVQLTLYVCYKGRFLVGQALLYCGDIRNGRSRPSIDSTLSAKNQAQPPTPRLLMSSDSSDHGTSRPLSSPTCYYFIIYCTRFPGISESDHSLLVKQRLLLKKKKSLQCAWGTEPYVALYMI